MVNSNQITSSGDFSALAGMLAVYGVIFLFVFVFGLVSYIFQSIGLYRMAKSLSFQHPWFAWIPILNVYTLGKIGSKYIKNDGRPSAKFGGWLLGLDLGVLVACGAMITSVVTMIISGISMGTSGSEPTPAFLGGAISFLLTYLLLIGMSIAFSVVYYIALWRVYSIFSSSNATVFLVLSIIFSVTTPFFIFAIRKGKPCLTYADRMGFVPQAQSTNAQPEVVMAPPEEETLVTNEAPNE